MVNVNISKNLGHRQTVTDLAAFKDYAPTNTFNTILFLYPYYYYSNTASNDNIKDKIQHFFMLCYNKDMEIAKDK